MPSPLPPVPVRPFRTAAVRRAVLAPEVERYLDRRRVDLLVTDQIEAVRVRVAAGLDVLARRLAAADGVARRLARRWTLAVGLLSLIALGGGVTTGDPWFLAVPLPGIAALVPLARALADLRQARRLRPRYTIDLARCETADDLLELASGVLEEARILGVAPAPAVE